MTEEELLRSRLAAVGLPVRAVVPARGGVIATAGLVTLDDGRQVFAKTLAVPLDGLFEAEADGLRALRELGGAATPEVLIAAPDVLVLAAVRPCCGGTAYWEALGWMIADMHTTAIGPRFGWHSDGWLGRMPQDNTWHDDGYTFFAQRRILRWLPEPHVVAAFDKAERQALERLCDALPELVPSQPPTLTHGDLWSGNLLADHDGTPVLVDPAVSYTWPEVDLGMLWCSPAEPGKERFFDAYAEVDS